MKGVYAIIVAAPVLIAAAAGIAWYYAGVIERQALAVPPPPLAFDLVVSAIGDGEITLRPAKAMDRVRGDLLKPGRYGIASATGDGVVGEIVRRDGDSVTRKLLSMDASIAPGDEVRLRALTYFGDPLSAHGLAFNDVAFESDIGPLGAWYVAGTSNTWAIVVHGRGIDRREGLKLLPVLTALGLQTLLIQYRNDEGVAGSASGFYDYGLSEWRDLEAAVGYALEHGASDIVLIGYSMGGAIIANFLDRSDLAGRVSAVVLDSPIVDFGAVIDFGGEQRHLWRGLTWLGKAATSLRSGISWSDLDYLRRAEGLTAPILLIHGDADPVVPIRGSDRLAAARPDLVTYLRLEDVGHVRGWNVDQQAYEESLAAFLKNIVDVANGSERPQ